MFSEKVKQASNICIGAKRATKMADKAKASKVFVAKDTDPRMTLEIINLCKF
jgi:large subunit ribosomal protein L7A